jgi:hypothetical protein
MKKNHPFKLTLLSLAIAASFSAYAHAEYTESENTEIAKTKKSKTDKTVELDEMVVTTERAD